jgi:hypothetical protein
MPYSISRVHPSVDKQRRKAASVTNLPVAAISCIAANVLATVCTWPWLGSAVPDALPMLPTHTTPLQPMIVLIPGGERMGELHAAKFVHKPNIEQTARLAVFVSFCSRTSCTWHVCDLPASSFHYQPRHSNPPSSNQRWMCLRCAGTKDAGTYARAPGGSLLAMVSRTCSCTWPSARTACTSACCHRKVFPSLSMQKCSAENR